MSGIGLIFHRDGASVLREDIERMTNALRLYGPLKRSSRTYENFGLCWAQAGHFTPEDKFDVQPLTANGQFPMVFSGFLLHREELATKLGFDAKRLRTLADSMLAHAAWQKWNKRFVEHLYGDYAILLCDQSENRVFAFRSEGVATPVFYHVSKSRILLACAPKGIFALGDIDREIDEQRVADSLILNNQDVEQSFYKNIKSLPLGHFLEAGREQLAISRHYDIKKSTDVRFAQNRDYIEAANELFDRSIESNMRCTKTPAATLSSGLDSSSVVVGALEFLKRQNDPAAQKMVSYTAVPAPGWDGTANGCGRVGDESGPVRALAKAYPQLDARFLNSEGLPIDHDLDKIILLSETPPFAANNLHWFINLMQTAAREGHNAILTGGSGNRSLSFSGKAIFAKLFRQGRWLKLYRELRGSDNQDRRFMGLYGRAIIPNLPPRVVSAVSAIRGTKAQRGWREYSAINPDYAGDMRVSERALEQNWDEHYQGFSSQQEMMKFMAETGTRDLGQNIQQAIQALTGVQIRDPLSDRKLTAFCMGLPEDQFMKNGKDRLLIKRMMAERLPREILHAPRGRQAADWHMRMTRDLSTYKAEVERMGDNPEMAKRFNIPLLQSILDNWPNKTPMTSSDHQNFAVVRNGLSRAIATSRFINSVEGKN